jgi:TRAP-type transport system periplasmic protein
MRIVSAIVAAAVSSLLVGTQAIAQQYTMRIASPTINDSAQAWGTAFKTGIEQRSGGRVKVQYYPGGQLGSIPSTMDGVSLGTLEAAATAVGFVIPFDARFQVLDAAGLYDDIPHARRIFTDPEIRAALKTYAANKNMETLWVAGAGDMGIASRKPIRTLADFQGLKLRITGSTPFYVDPMKKLGVSPVAMSLGDALPSMQNGTIDGAVALLNYFSAVKYYDVTKYATYVPRSLAITTVVISRSFLKGLGPELEAMVREESLKAEDVLYDQSAALDKLGKDNWLKNGGELIRLSEKDTQAYLDASRSVVSGILSQTPAVKAEYDRFVAASNRLRR